jgi:hypothetical protein
MHRYQFSMVRRSSPPSKRRGLPDLAAVFEVVNPRIEEAARAASARMHELGVRHALVGGLAVGAYARPRATKDVDFLVGAEAWPTSGSIVSPIPGLPFRVGTVEVDTLLAPAEAPGIEEALARAKESEGIPVAPPEVVMLMKLIAGRPQDVADLDALLDVVDHGLVQQYVSMHASEYAPDLEAAIRDHGRPRRVRRKRAN